MSSANERHSVYERPNHFTSLNSIRERDAFCDVTIKVGNKEIRAHRLILSATINYFHRMFLGDFEESKKDVISIDNVSENTIEDIITFSYTGKITFTKENAANLLRDADFLELTDVKDKCIEFLKSDLELENVFVALHLANLLPGCSSLFESSKAFIRRNLRDACLVDDYSILDFELLESLLSEKDSNVSPELMFEAIMRWLLNDVDSKKTHLPELLRHVDLFELEAEFLVSSLFKDEFRVNIGGPRHSELVTEVLSVFNTLMINNVPKIYIEEYNDGYAEIYDFTTDEWNSTTFVHALDTDSSASVFRYKNKLCKFPSESRNEQATMSICNVKDKVWINSKIVVPFNTSFSSAVLLDDFFYVCGGRKNSSEIMGIDNVWRISLKTRSWQAVSPMKQLRSEPHVVTLHGFIYVIGGQKHHDFNSSITMERYDPQKNEWTSLSDLNVEKYDSFSAVGCGDKIYLCGGIMDTINFVETVYAYDLTTNKWKKMASMNAARDSPLVVEHMGKIWAMGGTAGVHDEYKELSSVEVYDPVTDSWTYGKPMNKLRGFVRGCVFSTSS